MGLEFKAYATMKNIGDEKTISKLINYIKKDKDFDIGVESSQNSVSLKSSAGYLYENFDEAIRKLSLENPDKVICYENCAEGTNAFSIADAMSFINVYMKNGIDILKYDERYRPVYVEDLKKDYKLDLDFKKFEIELEEREKKIADGTYDYMGALSVLVIPTGHDVFFKKPLQRYYKILDGDINKEVRITYDEFVSYFDKDELDIFKDEFVLCDSISNNEMSTGWEYENEADVKYLEGLKTVSSFDEFIEKFCEDLK